MTKFIRSEQFDGLKFRLYVANEPTVQTVMKPKLSLTEFLVYVLSCFGIWLGLSFYSLAKLVETGGQAIYGALAKKFADESDKDTDDE